MCARLAGLLPNLISPHQRAFVRGHSIFDNISLAQEICREVGKPDGRPNVVFSLDMRKAYDRLEWDFLFAVLRHFGFADHWIEIIKACVTSVCFSVIFNGQVKRFFHASRGLRQGDPLSPSLFILAEDVLSRLFTARLSRMDEFSTTLARFPTHLLFADDILLFLNAKRHTITKVLDLLAAYSNSSGQRMNPAKCCFFLPSKAPRSQAYVIRSTTGFERGSFPFIYLGVPVGPGKRQARHFQHIIDRIMERTNGWQAKLLSDAGRLVLIKHVLSLIPIHILSATTIPEICLKKIESILANFFWGKSDYGKRRHWCKWDKLCRPVGEGGLGIRNLRDVRRAFILKKCWMVASSEFIWGVFMRAKYRIPVSPVFWSGPQRCSPEWREMLMHRLDFAAKCGWNVGRGDISFWRDNWCKDFSFEHLAVDGFDEDKLCEFWNGEMWDFGDLIPTIGEELSLLTLENAPTLSEDRDMLFWRLTSSGMFSVSLAWESVRRRGRTNRVLAQTWASPMPTKSKLLIWRMLKSILPADLVVKHRGFQLASQCVCCSEPKEESLLHLFLDSDLAVSLWSYFGSVFAVPNQPSYSLMARLSWWFFACKGSSHFATLGRMAAIAICRQIWSYRNNTVYGGMCKPFVHARLVVIDTLQFVEHLVTPGITSSSFGKDSLLMIGITPRDPPISPLSRRLWSPPSRDRSSIHCASTISGQMAGVGAIISDHDGGMLGALAGPIGPSHPRAADTLALRWSVDLATNMGTHAVDFWASSDFLIENISLPCPLWNYSESWSTIQTFFHHHSSSIRSTPRVGNAIALALADWGLSLDRVTFFCSVDTLQLRVRRALVRDVRAFVDPGG